MLAMPPTYARRWGLRSQWVVGWGAPDRSGASEHEELDASRDVELDARDVRGEVGAQECDRVRDVLRLPRALEHRPRGDPLVHGCVGHVERLCPYDARNDRVARDPVAPTLHRERLREAEDPGFRRRGARLAEPAERPRDRG